MKSKNDELKKVKEKRKELMNGEGEEKGKAEDAQSKYIGGCQIEPYSLNTKKGKTCWLELMVFLYISNSIMC